MTLEERARRAEGHEPDGLGAQHVAMSAGAAVVACVVAIVVVSALAKVIWG